MSNLVKKENYKNLNGSEKAAILMLALGEEHAAKLFEIMDEEEIRELSQAMSALGTVDAGVIERLFVEFTDQVRRPARLSAPWKAPSDCSPKCSAKTVSRSSWTRSADPPAGPCGTSSAM